jgi:hypothetical protein
MPMKYAANDTLYAQFSCCKRHAGPANSTLQVISATQKVVYTKCFLRVLDEGETRKIAMAK